MTEIQKQLAPNLTEMDTLNSDPEYHQAAEALIDQARLRVLEVADNAKQGVEYNDNLDSIERPITLRGKQGDKIEITLKEDVYTVRERLTTPRTKDNNAPRRQPRKLIFDNKTGRIVNQHYMPGTLDVEQFTTDLTEAQLAKPDKLIKPKTEKYTSLKEAAKVAAGATAVAGVVVGAGYLIATPPSVDALSPGVSASPNHQDQHEQEQRWGDPIAEAQHVYDDGVKVTGVETAAIAQADGRTVNGLKVTLYEPHSRDAFNDDVKYGGTVAIVPHDAQHDGQDYWLNMAPDQRTTEDTADATAEHVQTMIPLEAQDVPQDGTRINLYATANAKDPRYPDKLFQALHYAGQLEVRHDAQNSSALTAQIVEADPNDTPQDALITASDPDYHGAPQPPLIMPGEAAPAGAQVVNIYTPPLELPKPLNSR